MSALEQMDDESLLRRYAELNDREALGTLFRRHAGAAYTTALRLCRNRADAEDAVQGAFVNIMQNAANYRGGSKFGVRAWIAKIVIGTVKTRIRSEVRRRIREEEVVEASEDMALPEGAAGDRDPNELTGAVDEALSNLPEHYRLPIVLHHCEGLSLHETAEMLEVSENTLSRQLTRGMKNMRRALAAGGVAVNGAVIVAALPLLAPESAPASLLNSIPQILTSSGGAGAVAGAATAAGTGLLKPFAIGIAAVAVATTGGIYLAHKSQDKPPSAPVAAPESGEREYVDGPIVLRDDFEKGYDNWESGFLGGAAKGWHDVSDPARAEKCIRIEKIDYQGKQVNALVVTEPGLPDLVSVAKLRQPAAVKAFSVEYNWKPAVKTQAALIIQRETGRTEVIERKPDFVLKPGVWHAHRLEVTPADGRTTERYYDVKEYCDGVLIFRYALYGGQPAAGFTVTKGSVMVASVVFREMVQKTASAAGTKRQ